MIPKFRAYLNIHKKIVDVQEINYKHKEIVWVNGKYTEVDNFVDIELLQSTGLFDKNGKEIFEGDIVKNKINEVGYIKWSKSGFKFCDNVGHFYLFSVGAGQPFEILGNRFEHPHLLGED